jgi:hypothetical protein
MDYDHEQALGTDSFGCGFDGGRRNNHRGDDAIPGFARCLRQRQLLIAACDEPIAPIRKSRTPSVAGARRLGALRLRQRELERLRCLA